MTSNSIEERKQYISRVRASFGTKEETVNQETDTEENTFDFGFFKLKLLVAVAIFAAFLYCDQNNITLYNKKTKDVYEQIEKTLPIENLIKEIENMIP